MLMELIGDILPAGSVNIVTGFGAEAGQALRLQNVSLNFHSLVLLKLVVSVPQRRKHYSSNYGIRWKENLQIFSSHL
jgi:hypothetical protein